MTEYRIGKYIVGIAPTEEEWQVYDRVRAFCDHENVAAFLEKTERDITQEQFERMCEAYQDYCMNDGENDWWLLDEAYDEAMREEA